MYTFVELSCPYEDKKNNTEQGDSKVSIAIQRVSAVLMGSLRNGFPLKYTRKLVITSKDKRIHKGTARYHRDSIFLAFSRKSTEPEKEIMLSNSTMAVKSKSDASKSDITGSGVVMDMELNMTDTKPVTQAIRKAADVKARAIFIFINSSSLIKSGGY